MSVAGTITKSFSLGGVSFPQNTSLGSDGQMVFDVLVPKGDASVLAVRTSDTVGDLTITDSGHSIDTGERIDLYWVENGVKGRRRDVLVGTVVGATVPFTGGLGDILPAQSTAIVASEPVVVDLAVNGTNVIAILLHATKNGQFVFEDSVGEILFVALDDVQSFEHNNQSAEVNPITGKTVVSVFASHDDPVNAKSMRIGVMYNNA